MIINIVEEGKAPCPFLSSAHTFGLKPIIAIIESYAGIRAPTLPSPLFSTDPPSPPLPDHTPSASYPHIPLHYSPLYPLITPYNTLYPFITQYTYYDEHFPSPPLPSPSDATVVNRNSILELFPASLESHIAFSLVSIHVLPCI